MPKHIKERRLKQIKREMKALDERTRGITKYINSLGMDIRDLENKRYKLGKEYTRTKKTW